jgi:hypothetical protein
MSFLFRDGIIIVNLQLLEDVIDRVNYEPWPEDKKIDFVLVYEPIKNYMDFSTGEGLILIWFFSISSLTQSVF